MKTESKTPRTDAQPRTWESRTLLASYETVPRDFARQLELELTAAQEHAERLRVALEKRDLGPVVIEWMRKYDEATKSEERDENCQIIRIPKRHIPKGATLIEAYETESQYIIIGQPADIEDENDPRFHNCDAMGCSSVSHVVLRADKALAAPSGQRSPWLPIESAPRDGTMFIGLRGGYVAPTNLGKYYEKWPHEDGGPTYREEWENHQSDSVTPWKPTHWMPLPSAPETIAQEGGE